MPFTVITVKNAPRSVRGDLTKWMQEIATGVYVGNFNTKVREQLWDRVKDSVASGEATLSYAYRNEIGYSFDTVNAQRKVIDFDGIPLIQYPSDNNTEEKNTKYGYSNAAKYLKAKKYSVVKAPKNNKNFVVIDIETSGLNENKDEIIEIAALKVIDNQVNNFQAFVRNTKPLSPAIIQLTGITQEILETQGRYPDVVLRELVDFIEQYPIIGYNVNFDIMFINNALEKYNMPVLSNKRYDLMKYVKKEKMFLRDYKLQTVLEAYGIDKKVPHRADLDCQIIYELSQKVNNFLVSVK